ncbi:MAG TPA: hypothetical protein PKZ76_15755 [Xanthomonadaceae bacterium]|nr:hypothetical protein [Xanthomonadaceae bacterium]
MRRLLSSCASSRLMAGCEVCIASAARAVVPVIMMCRKASI